MELLLDISRVDEGLPDMPSASDSRDWTVFVQAASGGYVAEVTIEARVTFRGLAERLVELLAAVAAGERPFLAEW